HYSVEPSIPMKVKLIDLWCSVRLTQLLKAHRAERRYAKHCSVFRSRSCDGAFTLAVEKTLQGGRGAIDRQSQFLAHNGYGEVNAFYPTQDMRHQVTAFEAPRVTFMRYLIVGGAVDVIEYWTRDPSLGQISKIMKVVTVAQ